MEPGEGLGFANSCLLQDFDPKEPINGAACESTLDCLRGEPGRSVARGSGDQRHVETCGRARDSPGWAGGVWLARSRERRQEMSGGKGPGRKRRSHWPRGGDKTPREGWGSRFPREGSGFGVPTCGRGRSAGWAASAVGRGRAVGEGAAREPEEVAGAARLPTRDLCPPPPPSGAAAPRDCGRRRGGSTGP